MKASEGSMRDAQSLLDQIISFSGQEVVDEDVRDVLGFIPKRNPRSHDRRSRGAQLQELCSKLSAIVVDQGLNIQQYVREFIGRVRDLLLMKLGLRRQGSWQRGREDGACATAEAFSEQDLIRYFDMLLRLENDLRLTSQPRFHLEVGLVKLAKVGTCSGYRRSSCAI